MDDTALGRFAALVAEIALEEELRLRRAAGEGIFFMPELAFAFAVGRAAAFKSHEIFGEPGWKWQRERKIGKAGPVDLVFSKGEEGPRVLVEFKMRDTLEAYQCDIAKLQALAGKDEHQGDSFLFCALLDVWANKPFDDPRLVGLEMDAVGREITLFTTKQDWYERQVSCVVGVWEVA